MKRLDIIFDGQIAEFGTGKAPFRLFREYVNYLASSKRGGTFSYTINFPNTPTNAAIFGRLDHPAQVDKFARNFDLNVSVEIDGLPVLVGTAVVNQAPAGDYAVLLRGMEIDWAAKMNKPLRSLTTLGEVPVVGYAAAGVPPDPADPITMPDFWTTDGTQYPLQFPLVAYGNYPSATALEAGWNGGRADNLKWPDIPPSIYWWRMFQACFEEVGLRVTGSFFKSAEFRSRITPYTGDGDLPWNWGLLAQVGAQYVGTRSEIIDISTDTSEFRHTAPTIPVAKSSAFFSLKTSTTDYDYSESYYRTSPNEQYFCPTTGNYTFEIDLPTTAHTKPVNGVFPVGLGGPNPDYDRFIIAIVRIPEDTDDQDALYNDLTVYAVDGTSPGVSDANIIALFDAGTGYAVAPLSLNTPDTTGTTFTQSTTPSGPGFIVNGSGRVYLKIEGSQLQRGDRIAFYYITPTPLESDRYTGDYLDITNYSVAVTFPEGDMLLQAAKVCPDMTQIDFVNSVIRAFNLYYVVDGSQDIITFETRDAFHLPKDIAVDWTAKADINAMTKIPFPTYQRTRFRWKDDTRDVVLQQVGLERFCKDVESDTIYAQKGDELIEVGFAPTVDRQFRFRHGVGGVSWLIIPCMGADNTITPPRNEITWAYNFMPRVLIWQGLRTGTWSFHGVAEPQYPSASFSFSAGTTYSNSFQDDGGVYLRFDQALTSPIQNTGLYTGFWARFVAHRRGTYIGKVDVLLTHEDFRTTNPAQLVVIDGNYYEIAAYPDGFDPVGNDPTTVELVWRGGN